MKAKKKKQLFMSKKIRKLLDEGKPMKQAIAIALSMYEKKK
jgi:hypothetical protein|tara:strand:- start:867 stop:989 length:123 start_codon:yes stop_codon:yes gene_type:complete